MENLVLLLLGSIVCLCDGGSTYYGRNGFLTTDNEGSSEEAETSCGTIRSSGGAQFRTAEHVIMGGADSKYHEFPWIAALFAPNVMNQQCELRDSDCWFFRCAGFLISSKVMLVAGQCVYPYKKDRLKARAGDWNLDTFDEFLPYQERFVAQMIIHPLFRADPAFRNDAALLVMESSYRLRDNIGFICLPPPDLHVASPSCKLAGFRKRTVNGAGQHLLLHAVDSNIIDHGQCERTIRSLMSSTFVLHDSFTCAACREDGDALLVCRAEDHYYARGAASWGFACDKINPVVFTDFVKVRNWIDQEMRGNDFDTETYTHVAYWK